MKVVLISTVSALVTFGAAFAREAIVIPIGPFHGEHILPEHRDAQLTQVARKGGVLCTTMYIPTRDDRGWYIRESVDCEE